MASLLRRAPRCGFRRGQKAEAHRRQVKAVADQRRPLHVKGAHFPLRQSSVPAVGFCSSRVLADPGRPVAFSADAPRQLNSHGTAPGAQSSTLARNSPAICAACAGRIRGQSPPRASGTDGGKQQAQRGSPAFDDSEAAAGEGSDSLASNAGTHSSAGLRPAAASLRPRPLLTDILSRRGSLCEPTRRLPAMPPLARPGPTAATRAAHCPRPIGVFSGASRSRARQRLARHRGRATPSYLIQNRPVLPCHCRGVVGRESNSQRRRIAIFCARLSSSEPSTSSGLAKAELGTRRARFSSLTLSLVIRTPQRSRRRLDRTNVCPGLTVPIFLLNVR